MTEGERSARRLAGILTGSLHRDATRLLLAALKRVDGLFSRARRWRAMASVRSSP